MDQSEVAMIQLDFESATPVYKQIVEQVLLAVKRGELRPGERLPTERELAASLQVARGTVKKAYKELADHNLIESIQGSGSYVYDDRSVPDAEARRQALAGIDALLDRLERWEMDEAEIAALFRLSLAKRSSAGRLVRAALVDCNPESLQLFKRQLQYIPALRTSAFQIDTVLMEDDPGKLLEGFDLVLTTATHYERLAACLRPHGISPVAVDVSPARDTIVDLSTLDRDKPIGILCRSNKFANLVLEQLELFAGAKGPVPLCFDDDPEKALRFIRRFRTVLVSPDLPLLSDESARPEIDRFLAGGGTILPFDYRIDRGSLIHVECLVDERVRAKAGQPSVTVP